MYLYDAGFGRTASSTHRVSCRWILLRELLSGPSTPSARSFGRWCRCRTAGGVLGFSSLDSCHTARAPGNACWRAALADHMDGASRKNMAFSLFNMLRKPSTAQIPMYTRAIFPTCTFRSRPERLSQGGFVQNAGARRVVEVVAMTASEGIETKPAQKRCSMTTPMMAFAPGPLEASARTGQLLKLEH